FLQISNRVRRHEATGARADSICRPQAALTRDTSNRYNAGSLQGAHTMPKSDLPRIAVLGAGPIGLEAALYAASLGMPVAVYERERVGAYLQQWGHVRLFSPFGMNHTPLGRDIVRA